MSKLYELRREQTLPVPKAELWSFIASPRNLATITPPYMRIEVLGMDEEKMYAGQIINYNVRPVLGLKINWVTEITHVDEGNYFVDEQRFGPYSFWHHLHQLNDVPGGVKMIDTVRYKIPYGIAGDWVNAWVVAKRLREIFDFRFSVLEKRFGA